MVVCKILVFTYYVLTYFCNVDKTRYIESNTNRHKYLDSLSIAGKCDIAKGFPLK